MGARKRVNPYVLVGQAVGEGLFGNRGMLIEDTLSIVSELQARVENSLNLIEAELDE